MTSVSIIIVTWNVERFIEACLRSIPAALGSLAGEVIVVDNVSQDDTREKIRAVMSDLPMVTLLEPGKNIGFAAGNNLALRQATGEYLLLLNPDTVLQPGAIEHLVSCARQASAGIVGGRHLNPDGSQQPSVRRLPTTLAMTWLLLKLHRLLAGFRPWRRYIAADFDYRQTQPVEQVAGSCLLITRTALQQIGHLDEGFHLWFEEVDWCQRARQAGIRVVYCAQARLTHFGAASFGQLGSVDRQRRFNRSLRRYAKKHFSWTAWLLICALSPISLGLAALTPARASS